jgi:ABC-type branched-subunit amino acid transport system ATPase component
MELILKAKDIRVEFKGRDVLDINELEVYDYDRIGLVGANGNHSIFRLDTHRNLTYLCAVTFKNNDYGKRKSKLSGGI